MIRPATLADVDWFVEQARNYLAETGDELRFDATHTRERIADILASDAVVAYVAEGRGHVLATVYQSLYHPGDYVARVVTLWVLPAHRGSGTGVRLLRACERECERRGARLMWTDESLRLPDRAARMYERMGYAPVQVLFQKVIHGH